MLGLILVYVFQVAKKVSKGISKQLQEVKQLFGVILDI